MRKKNLIIIGVFFVAMLFVVILILLLGREDKDDNGLVQGKLEVEITSSPQNAKVYLDDNGPFITPEKVYLYPGEYDLWAFKENYYLIEKTVYIGEDEDRIFLNFTEVPLDLRNDEDFEPQEIDPYPY